MILVFRLDNNIIAHAWDIFFHTMKSEFGCWRGNVFIDPTTHRIVRNKKKTVLMWFPDIVSKPHVTKPVSKYFKVYVIRLLLSLSQLRGTWSGCNFGDISYMIVIWHQAVILQNEVSHFHWYAFILSRCPFVCCSTFFAPMTSMKSCWSFSGDHDSSFPTANKFIWIPHTLDQIRNCAIFGTNPQSK